MMPGHTQLTRICRGASSSARARVNWSSAPLLAEYGALFSQATSEFIEAMFTIEPPSRSTGTAARQT